MLYLISTSQSQHRNMARCKRLQWQQNLFMQLLFNCSCLKKNLSYWEKYSGNSTGQPNGKQQNNHIVYFYFVISVNSLLGREASYLRYFTPCCELHCMLLALELGYLNNRHMKIYEINCIVHGTIMWIKCATKMIMWIKCATKISV